MLNCTVKYCLIWIFNLCAKSVNEFEVTPVTTMDSQDPNCWGTCKARKCKVKEIKTANGKIKNGNGN